MTHKSFCNIRVPIQTDKINYLKICFKLNRVKLNIVSLSGFC